jgi:hypothetical protein
MFISLMLANAILIFRHRKYLIGFKHARRTIIKEKVRDFTAFLLLF